MPSASNTSNTRTSGVVDRQVRALLEGQAVQLVGGVEHAVLQHVVQLEVGLELRFVEGVLLARAPSRCSTPSPRPRAGSRRLPVSMIACMSAASLAGVGHGGRRQLGQQLVDRVRRCARSRPRARRRRGWGSRAARRARRAAWPSCATMLAVVELAAAAAAGERGLVQALAQRAVLRARLAAAGRWCSAARARTCLPGRVPWRLRRRRRSASSDRPSSSSRVSTMTRRGVDFLQHVLAEAGAPASPARR